MLIRRATISDLECIAGIQGAVPEAAQWNPADYLEHDCFVAEEGGVVAGFLVSRAVADEREILNIAVAPEFRRRGVGASLVRDELQRAATGWFLEVRESNAGARAMYAKLGFKESGIRRGYYHTPYESAVVMSIFS